MTIRRGDRDLRDLDMARKRFIPPYEPDARSKIRLNGKKGRLKRFAPVFDDPNLFKRMAVTIRRGMAIDRAARLAGVNERTFRLWKSKAWIAIEGTPDWAYREFFEKLERVRLECMTSDLELWKKMIIVKRDPRAMAEFVGVVFPEEFGKRLRLTAEVVMADSAMQLLIEIVSKHAGPEIAAQCFREFVAQVEQGLAGQAAGDPG